VPQKNSVVLFLAPADFVERGHFYANCLPIIFSATHARIVLRQRT